MQSSTDSTKVSASVTGAILMASSAILLIAQWAKFPLTQGDVLNLATSLGMASGLVVTVFGLLRKLIVNKTA